MLARAKNYGKMRNSLIEINITKSLIILHKIDFFRLRIYIFEMISTPDLYPTRYTYFWIMLLHTASNSYGMIKIKTEENLMPYLCPKGHMILSF